ncbi:MAG: hypothetical protein WCT42_01910 [Candidatus Paceibacterota bacterium]
MKTKKIFEISFTIAIIFFIGIIASSFLSKHNVSTGIINIKTVWSICIYAWGSSFAVAIIFGIKTFLDKKFPRVS